MAGNANSGRHKAPRAIREAKGKRTYNKQTDTVIVRDSRGYPIEDGLIITGALIAPDILTTDFELNLWNRLTLTMEEGVFCPLDEVSISHFIKQVGILNTLFDLLENTSLEVVGSKGQPKISDVIDKIQSQQKLVSALGSRLGLDPVARSSIQVPDKKTSGDIW